MTNSALRNVLLLAFGPCENFAGPCAECRWEPFRGYVPRGFGGGHGRPEDVRLVLVTEEPADPGDEERYANAAPESLLDQHLSFFEGVLRAARIERKGRPTAFHPRLRRVLDMFWPDLDLDRQLERTWMTNSVLCTIPPGRSRHRKATRDACTRAYLAAELNALPNA